MTDLSLLGVKRTGPSVKLRASAVVAVSWKPDADIFCGMLVMAEYFRFLLVGVQVRGAIRARGTMPLRLVMHEEANRKRRNDEGSCAIWKQARHRHRQQWSKVKSQKARRRAKNSKNSVSQLTSQHHFFQKKSTKQTAQRQHDDDGFRSAASPKHKTEHLSVHVLCR